MPRPIYFESLEFTTTGVSYEQQESTPEENDLRDATVPAPEPRRRDPYGRGACVLRRMRGTCHTRNCPCRTPSRRAEQPRLRYSEQRREDRERRHSDIAESTLSEGQPVASFDSSNVTVHGYTEAGEVRYLVVYPGGHECDVVIGNTIVIGDTIAVVDGIQTPMNTPSISALEASFTACANCLALLQGDPISAAVAEVHARYLSAFIVRRRLLGGEEVNTDDND